MDLKLLKTLSQSLGLLMLLFGLVVSIRGFGTTINASWGMSSVFQGFGELLFGITFLLLGNGLINLGK